MHWPVFDRLAPRGAGRENPRVRDRGGAGGAGGGGAGGLGTGGLGAALAGRAGPGPAAPSAAAAFVPLPRRKQTFCLLYFLFFFFKK